MPQIAKSLPTGSAGAINATGGAIGDRAEGKKSWWTLLGRSGQIGLIITAVAGIGMVIWAVLVAMGIVGAP